MSVVCSFCQLDASRSQGFMPGLSGYVICDRCVALMTRITVPAHDPRVPGPQVVGSSRRLEGAEAGEMRGRFAAIVCRFCGRSRGEFGPGGFAGQTPETFICAECLQRAKDLLLRS
jgi:hypothetical protein